VYDVNDSWKRTIDPINNFRLRLREEMSVTYMELKTGESAIAAAQLHLDDPGRIRLFTASSVVRDCKSDVRAVLRSIMSKCASDSGFTYVLMNTHLWLVPGVESDTHRGAADLDQDDSEDEDGGVGSTSNPSINLVLSLSLWFISTQRANRLVVLFESQIPSRLRAPGIITDRVYLASSVRESSSPIAVAGQDPLAFPLTQVVGIFGPSKSGKTAFLKSLPATSVWMYTHEILHCELGESTRIVRDIFSRASGRSPSIVVLDDADLVLSTSGRIMREIVEELGGCLGDFPRVGFVYTARDKSGVPEIILARTSREIKLNS
jgi:hypothetical protein